MFGFSWSWKRAVGLSAAKGKISRAIGIPLTESGREKKLGRMVGNMVGEAAAGIGGSTPATHVPLGTLVQCPHCTGRFYLGYKTAKQPASGGLLSAIGWLIRKLFFL